MGIAEVKEVLGVTSCLMIFLEPGSPLYHPPHLTAPNAHPTARNMHPTEDGTHPAALSTHPTTHTVNLVALSHPSIFALNRQPGSNFHMSFRHGREHGPRILSCCGQLDYTCGH